MSWLATLLAAAGIGTSLYGANKASKDLAGTNAANARAAEEGDRKAWINYLLQRGLYAGADTQYGQIPGMKPGAWVNQKLPLGATLRSPAPQFSGSLVRRRM